MRSLGTIRARVERLASTWPVSPETTFIHWMDLIERCPACGDDLVAHARAAALAEAVTGRDPRALPPPLVWIKDLAMCPHCGAPIPS